MQKAFTIIELLIAVSLTTILLVIALPPLQEMINKNNAKAHTSEIFSALQFTRMAAIKTGEEVIFCKSSDRKSCGGTWSDGQIVITQGGILLRFYAKVKLPARLIWKSSMGKNDAITFLPSGIPNGQQGTFYYCPENLSENGMAVVLGQTGRLRIDESVDAGC
jgi:type IV fimbrial biogenesis protein FimT